MCCMVVVTSSSTLSLMSRSPFGDTSLVLSFCRACSGEEQDLTPPAHTHTTGTHSHHRHTPTPPAHTHTIGTHSHHRHTLTPPAHTHTTGTHSHHRHTPTPPAHTHTIGTHLHHRHTLTPPAHTHPHMPRVQRQTDLVFHIECTLPHNKLHHQLASLQRQVVVVCHRNDHLVQDVTNLRERSDGVGSDGGSSDGRE